MLNVTNAALKQLNSRLITQSATEDTALRFKRREKRWRLEPDRERPGDVTFASDGRNVLLLDESIAQATANWVLDVRSTSMGPRLNLRRADA